MFGLESKFRGCVQLGFMVFGIGVITLLMCVVCRCLRLGICSRSWHVSWPDMDNITCTLAQMFLIR